MDTPESAYSRLNRPSFAGGWFAYRAGLGHLESCVEPDSAVANKIGELTQVHPSRLYKSRRQVLPEGLGDLLIRPG
jgi:hypothetical protein